MHRLDRFFECPIPRCGGLQYEENFLCLGNLSLPTINRLNSWNDIRTGSQLHIYHFFADPYSFFSISRRNQDNKNLPGWFPHKGFGHCQTTFPLDTEPWRSLLIE